MRTEGVSLGGRGVAGSPPTRAPVPTDRVLALDMGLVRKILVEFIREEVVPEGVRRSRPGGVGRSGFGGRPLPGGGGLGPESVTGFRHALCHLQPREPGACGAGPGCHRSPRAETIDITPTVDAYVQGVDPELSDLRRGNLAARVRGVTLFDQSAKLGRLPLGTGNKSERLLGYFTWHADDSPPINPLGDLFKTQVWALARHLGVPDVIVEKPASADLVRGIHDEDELGCFLPGGRSHPSLVAVRGIGLRNCWPWVRRRKPWKRCGAGSTDALEAGASHGGGPLRHRHRGVFPAAGGLLRSLAGYGERSLAPSQSARR